MSIKAVAEFVEDQSTRAKLEWLGNGLRTVSASPAAPLTALAKTQRRG